MIVSYAKDDQLENVGPPKFMLDIGRPNINDLNREDWKKFHTWVENSDIPIYISSAFHIVKNACENGHDYYGAGFKYQFWFDTNESKEALIKRLPAVLT